MIGFMAIYKSIPTFVIISYETASLPFHKLLWTSCYPKFWHFVNNKNVFHVVYATISINCSKRIKAWPQKRKPCLMNKKMLLLRWNESALEWLVFLNITFIWNYWPIKVKSSSWNDDQFQQYLWETNMNQ